MASAKALKGINTNGQALISSASLPNRQRWSS